MQLSSSPRSEAETTFPAPATPCLGYAAIVRMAYAGADLSDLTSKLVARVQGPVIDPGALLDLSALLQCQGGDLAFEGRIMQRRAIQLQSNYAIRHGRGTGLRILAFVTAGDFMANTPLDFLLNGSDAVLLLHFVDANTRALDDLPPHDVAFMAIGESPENAETLLVMTRLLAHWRGPIFNNAASLIASLTRDRVSHLLAGEPSILAPATHQLHRDDLRSLLHGVQLAALGEGLAFPLVLRPLGTHAGADWPCYPVHGDQSRLSVATQFRPHRHRGAGGGRHRAAEDLRRQVLGRGGDGWRCDHLVLLALVGQLRCQIDPLPSRLAQIHVRCVCCELHCVGLFGRSTSIRHW